MAGKGASAQPVRELVPGVFREALEAEDQRVSRHPQGLCGHELADGPCFRIQAHAGAAWARARLLLRVCDSPGLRANMSSPLSPPQPYTPPPPNSFLKRRCCS